MMSRRTHPKSHALCWIVLLLLTAATSMAVETVDNGIYQANVQSQASGDANHFGSWNALTGASHPAGANRDITFRGSRTTTNFSSLRVFRSASSFTDYTPTGRGGAMDLDPHLVREEASPLGPGWRTVWEIDAEGLRIVQDVIVVGTDLAGSAVYHTVEIVNIGSRAKQIGWRNLHDWSLNGGTTGPRDNPTNQLESRCGEILRPANRDEFSRDPVDAGLVRVALPNQAADYSPVLSLGFDPGFVPSLPVTVPDEYAYVNWRRAQGTAFDDTIQNLTGLGDSAGLSWFGRDFARAHRLDPGQSVRFTQTLFAFEGESCPQPPVCAKVPRGLVAWWPFNEGDQPGRSGRFADVARGHEGIARFAPASIPGKVGRAASFDGRLDEVVVQDAPDLDIPAGTDLSIDFWIRTTDTSGVSIVLEKRGISPLRGYQIFLFNGRVGLQLADASGFTNFVSSTVVADGEWHLVAVTVRRDDPQGGIWYVDGEEDSRFDPTPRSGSLSNDAQLLIGGRNPDAPSAGAPFAGDLDEVEIARRVFSPREILDIYRADSKGKCALTIDVPWETPLCVDETSVTSQLTVCNESGGTGRFVFDFEGLPPNPPGVPHSNLCEVPGPRRFTLLGSEPLVVPASECRTAVVRIDGLAPQPDGGSSCYSVTATDLVTGLAESDYGSIPTSERFCCRPLDPVTPVGPGNQGNIIFRIADTGFGSPAVNLQVEPFQNDETAPPGLRLADAEPGAAIDRRVSFGPDGIATLEVPVSLTEDFAPLAFYDVLLSAELDGDPERELLASATVVPGTRPCVEGLNGLCLTAERFRVVARWRTTQGEEGVSQAVPLTSDTGFFWFFEESNLEIVVKVLDACDFFNRFWVFAGGLTDVEVDLEVTDLLTGDVQRYFNPLGEPFQPVQDTNAFATCDAGGAADRGTAALDSATLDFAADGFAGLPKVEELPLNDDRFIVEVEWETTAGESGRGEGIALTPDTGYFWFFNESNVELAVKVLDACSFNNRFWVFAGGLTDVAVRLTVTDTVSGISRTYSNPLSTPFQPIQDTGAFDTCP